jgi:hypothetical protein
MWSIEKCVLQQNPCLMKKILDLMAYILSPVISSKDFDFFPDCVSTNALKYLRC